MQIILSPYASYLPNGRENAKNYPYWQEVVDALCKYNIDILQIGADKRRPLKRITHYYHNLPLPDILSLLSQSELWMAVDNFLQHLARFTQPLKQGIVVWGPSDPSLFGYYNNINLYKDAKYFRIDQYAPWLDYSFDQSGWIEPEKVVEVVLDLLRIKKNK